MKQIFESDMNCMESGGESASSIIVFECESEQELESLYEIEDIMDKDLGKGIRELEDLTGLYNEYGVCPGCLFHRFTFILRTPFLIVDCTTAYNV